MFFILCSRTNFTCGKTVALLLTYEDFIWTYQNAADQYHFKERRPQVKDQSTEHKANSSSATVDCFGQSSCLPAQMEPQIQVMKVEKDVLGYPPDGALSHLPKHCIPQLIEESCSSTGNTI